MVWSTAFDIDHSKNTYYDAPPRQQMAENANNFLDHWSFLDVRSAPPIMRLSSIICSIGPASSGIPILEKLLEAGMNIARVRYGSDPEEVTAQVIRNVRQAVDNYSKRLGMIFPLGIGLDIQGPEIHTGFLEGGPSATVVLKKGEQIKLTTDKAYYEKGNASVMYVDYDNIHKFVKIGNRIYLDGGLICLLCTNIQGSVLICTILNGGTVRGGRKINLPGISTDLPVVSEKDKDDIRLAIKEQMDMIFISNIRQVSFITEVRNLLGVEGRNMLVIAKIEEQQGLENIDEIIKAADGILIARGDMAVELPIEKLCLVQKSLIAKCNKAGIPVMCSNQLLSSMSKIPRPTGAECTDVANIILDGADCLVMNKETQNGDYPAEAVLTCANICKEVEAAIWHKTYFAKLVEFVVPPLESYHAIAISAVQVANKCLATAIVVLTTSGKSAFCIAKYRPACPIITITRHERTARIANLYRGLVPLVYSFDRLDNWPKDVEKRIAYGISFGKWREFIKAGDAVIAIHGSRKGVGSTDTLKILYVTKPMVEGVPCGCD